MADINQQNTEEINSAAEDTEEKAALGQDSEAAAAEDTDLQKQVDDLTARLAKEKNDYLFLRADFDNYRKRMLREREELLRNAAEKTLLGLLPIIDDFERGLDATRDADEASAVRQGMELIYHKLIKYLADNGVTPMESDGADFNPDLHEAIAAIPAPAPELKGKVIDTTQRGYMINDKVLRHAKVAVGE